MKVVKRVLIITVAIFILLSAFYFFWLSPRYVVPILMYHRFGYEDSTLFVTPENFNQQMAYIKSKGYDVISLDELVEGIKNNRKFKRHTVVITIDDGYKDSFTYAYPALKKYNFPATIFIITNSIDNKKDFIILKLLQRHIEKNGNIEPGSEFDKWKKWAMQQADKINSLV